jgi:hypothetical protein
MINYAIGKAGKFIRDSYSTTGTLVLHEELSANVECYNRTQTSTLGPRPNPPMPQNPYHFNYQRYSATQTVGNFNYASGAKIVGTGPKLGAVVGFTLEPPYSFTRLYNNALDKLTSKVRGDLDLSIDLAELGKTVKMLKATDDAVDYTKTFMKRFGVIKAASKAWLAYQYGMRPLISTIFGLADENLRLVLNKTSRFHVRATEYFKPDSVRYETIFGSEVAPVRSANIKKSVTIGCDLKTDQFDISRFSSLNPFSIAWELTPLSFVADWFFDLGSYLRNIETYVVNANKFNSGYVTNLSVGPCMGQINVRDPVGSDPRREIVIVFDGYHVNIDRTPLASYPAPTLPQLGADLGSSRLISAAALLAQLLKGH